MEDLHNEELVEYRADHMTLEELEHLSVETRFYNTVLKKLMARGAKVIVGPRGVGKTHHMRLAYKNCIESKAKPMPVYVSFSKYLRLEPLKNETSIAIQYFHCWVISKIILGVKDTLEVLSDLEDVEGIGEGGFSWNDIELFCEQIEKQQIREWHNRLVDILSVNFAIKVIDAAIEKCGRRSSIVLCDDAALVLTKDYMIEFFDIFRSLKTARISPKASVYPSTEFGPRFHLSQDAEQIPCWPNIEDTEYKDLFNTIYDKRFGDSVIKDEIKECFAYASFGVPRAYINLINRYLMLGHRSDQQKVNNIVGEQAQLILDEYMSLSIKQPQFSKYVLAGKHIISSISKSISADNFEKLKTGKQQYVLGVLQNGIENKSDKKKIDTIVKLLEEVGLIQKVSFVKHGYNPDKTPRVYDRYIPHFTLLLADGAYQVGNSGYITTFRESIDYPKAQPFRKKSFLEFYHDKENFHQISLDLPDCASCGNSRSSEEQRFCMYCGAQLINPSTYKTLIETKVDELPITKWLKDTIKRETNIETIGDIALSNNPGQELMKADGIGKVRASKVIDQAKDWMEEYLS